MTDQRTSGAPLTVAAAQRRLLEALADLARTPGLSIGTSGDPLTALAVGIQSATEQAVAADQHEVARVWACLGMLVLAAREDLRGDR